MAHRYDGKGGNLYDGDLRQSKAAECRQAASDAMKTAETYRGIGYPGNAAAAESQAQVLNNAALKIESGKPVSDYETRPFSG